MTIRNLQRKFYIE